jgi:hypothetical protein
VTGCVTGFVQGFCFVDERLMLGEWRKQPDAALIRQFLLNLALNHTVQVRRRA